MKVSKNITIISLFALFFLLQWGGQWSAVKASVRDGWRALFLITLYGCFLGRGLIWMIILRMMKLSRAYTLSSLTYLIVPLLSHVVLHEKIYTRYFLAGGLILAGIGLFGLGEQKKRFPYGK